MYNQSNYSTYDQLDAVLPEVIKLVSKHGILQFYIIYVFIRTLEQLR